MGWSLTEVTLTPGQGQGGAAQSYSRGGGGSVDV